MNKNFNHSYRIELKFAKMKTETTFRRIESELQESNNKLY